MLVDNFGQAIRLVLYGIRDALVISTFTPIVGLYYTIRTRRSASTLELVPALLVVSLSRNSFRGWNDFWGLRRTDAL